MKTAVLRPAQAQCVTPEDVVPVGRTETWRERIVRAVPFTLDGVAYEAKMAADEPRWFRAALGP